MQSAGNGVRLDPQSKAPNVRYRGLLFPADYRLAGRRATGHVTPATADEYRRANDLRHSDVATTVRHRRLAVSGKRRLLVITVSWRS